MSLAKISRTSRLFPHSPPPPPHRSPSHLPTPSLCMKKKEVSNSSKSIRTQKSNTQKNIPAFIRLNSEKSRLPVLLLLLFFPWDNRIHTTGNYYRGQNGSEEECINWTCPESLRKPISYKECTDGCGTAKRCVAGGGV